MGTLNPLPPAPPRPDLVWWNGRLVPEAEAVVSTASQGWLWGRGLFETIGVHDGLPFALTRHLNRFRAGATRLGLHPPDDANLRDAIAAVLHSCPPGAQRLRLTLGGGETPGLALAPDPGHLLIHRTSVAPSANRANLLTVPWRRNEFSPLAGVKSTSYAENAVALAWAQDRGATEALFLNTVGDLCEGAVSNLFLVRDGTVLTPFPGSGCLPGITRSLVIELCAQLGLPCLEKALTPADLVAADEVFLTNSLKGIHPVLEADQSSFDAPGPHTARVRSALHDLRRRLPDP